MASVKTPTPEREQDPGQPRRDQPRRDGVESRDDEDAERADALPPP